MQGSCMCQQGHGWLLLLLAVFACRRIFVGQPFVVWANLLWCRAPHTTNVCAWGGYKARIAGVLKKKEEALVGVITPCSQLCTAEAT